MLVYDVRMDFRAWLRKQSDRDDPVGDISREIGRDLCCSVRSVDGMRRHLIWAHKASAEAVEAFDRSAREWRDG